MRQTNGSRVVPTLLAMAQAAGPAELTAWRSRRICSSAWGTVTKRRNKVPQNGLAVARFNASRLRTAISRHNSAIRRYNSAVRSHNARVRAAVSAYNREVRRFNDLVRHLRSNPERVVTIYRVEWAELSIQEQVQIETEARTRGMQIELEDDE